MGRGHFHLKTETGMLIVWPVLWKISRTLVPTTMHERADWLRREKSQA